MYHEAKNEDLFIKHLTDKVTDSLTYMSYEVAETLRRSICLCKRKE